MLINKLKTLSLILALFSSVLAFAGTYAYYRIQFIEGGSDFKMSQQTVVPKSGIITLDRKTMVIDDRTYELKETKDRWKYRVKGGIVKLEYESGVLVAVRLHQYNQVYKYCIEVNPVAVTQSK